MAGHLLWAMGGLVAGAWLLLVVWAVSREGWAGLSRPRYSLAELLVCLVAMGVGALLRTWVGWP